MFLQCLHLIWEKHYDILSPIVGGRSPAPTVRGHMSSSLSGQLEGPSLHSKRRYMKVPATPPSGSETHS